MSEARNIVDSLGGRWFGSYGLCLCPAHRNTRTPALSVGTGADGRLLLHCHAGCEFADVVDSLRIRGLAAQSGRDHHQDQERPHVDFSASAGSSTMLRSAAAQRLWASAQPIDGTKAEHYLRLRGIICKLPRTLRCHAACRHASGQSMPALIGLVEGADAAGVHRTFLNEVGTGKAAVSPAKMMLGNCRGGAVRLCEAPGPLVVAEGIETALSLASGILPGHGPIWAALSTSGMMSLQLPEIPGELIIASDGDASGRKAAFLLAARADAAGWRVSILPAPEGRDWNDKLLGSQP